MNTEITFGNFKVNLGACIKHLDNLKILIENSIK